MSHQNKAIAFADSWLPATTCLSVRKEFFRSSPLNSIAVYRTKNEKHVCFDFLEKTNLMMMCVFVIEL